MLFPVKSTLQALENGVGALSALEAGRRAGPWGWGLWGKQGWGQTHLPERAPPPKHGYQHAGDHEAGQQAHQDAQQLCLQAGKR